MAGGFLKSKDFKDADIIVMSTFYYESANFTLMMDLASAATSLADMSNFWFREFYLELAKQVQFPIDMSMPWILVHEILESESPDLMQCVFDPRFENCR